MLSKHVLKCRPIVSSDCFKAFCLRKYGVSFGKKKRKIKNMRVVLLENVINSRKQLDEYKYVKTLGQAFF